jgi:hypothetical protein
VKFTSSTIHVRVGLALTLQNGTSKRSWFTQLRSAFIVTKTEKNNSNEMNKFKEKDGKTNMLYYTLARSKFRQMKREPLSIFVLPPVNQKLWTILRLNSNSRSLSTQPPHPPLERQKSVRKLPRPVIICHWNKLILGFMLPAQHFYELSKSQTRQWKMLYDW